MTQLEAGQVAVVTGGAKGIGFALAEEFAARGMHVVLADIEVEELDQARQKLEAGGTQVLAVPTDVTDEAAVNALAEATLDRFGSVEVVCNHAGIINGFRPVWDIGLDEWSRIISLNVFSVIYGIRAFVPHLVAQGHGHVVNTASMSGLRTVPGGGDYNMTKHAVVSLTETLRADLDVAAPGVGATVLCPGLTDTALARQATEMLAAARGTGVFDSSSNRPSSATVPSSAPVQPGQIAAIALAAMEADLLYAIASPHALAQIQLKIDRLLREAPGADDVPVTGIAWNQ